MGRGLFLYIKILILCFLMFFTTQGFCADYKIDKVGMDYSGKILTLRGNFSSQKVNYKAGFLSDPKRAYIDIEDAVFYENKKNYEFKFSKLKQLQIAQFSTSPNIVRIVFYCDDDEFLKNIKLEKIGKSLIFTLAKPTFKGDKYFQTYNDILPKEYKISTEENNINNLKFKSYVLTNVLQKNSHIMLSGVGSVKIGRPFVLTNPTRIVYDILNAVEMNDSILGEYKLANGDNVKIAKFTNNILRVVITTENTSRYKSFISPDAQNILFTSTDNIKFVPIPNFTTPADVTKAKIDKIKSDKSIVALSFSNPIIHSVRRIGNNLLIDLLNVDYTMNKDKFSIEHNEQFKGFTVQKMSANNNAVSLLIPLSETLNPEVELSLDGTRMTITLNGTYEKKNPISNVMPFPKTKIEKLPLQGKIIVVDAGHGGKDAGAISEKYYEKVSALAISKKLEAELKNQGATVIMTRDDDTFVSLQDRVAISNNQNATIFISIHLNSSEKSSPNGIETHWYKDNSKALAQAVHSNLIKNIKCIDRGLINSKFYVINHTEAPAILVEVGFISNIAERNELFEEKRQNATAKAIKNGVLEYFK